jgi:hypothetical protein
MKDRRGKSMAGLLTHIQQNREPFSRSAVNEL